MLTFEKIRDVERAERNSKDLMKLPDNFLDELREYIKRKETTKNKTEFDLMELENIKSTIKRIIELREHKIMSLALYSVRTGLPVENLTEQEEKLFSTVVEAFKKFREFLFENLKKEPAPPKEEIKAFFVKRVIPAFVGPDMKTYTLKENEIVNLSKALNDLLLKEGVIEERVIENENA